MDTAMEFRLNDDSAALYRRLIVPMEDRMMRTVWRIVRDPEEAKDTLQDVMARIWKKIHRIGGHPNPQALVLKICADAAVDTLRKSSRKKHYVDPEFLSQLADDSRRESVERLVQLETETEVMEAISRLPKKQAVAVLMRVIQEQPYSTIAAALGCKEATARIHVSRGRATLSRQLAHLQPAPSQEVRK
jgi:RNA polymerase sigma factor (sigma-70 family)